VGPRAGVLLVRVRLHPQCAPVPCPAAAWLSPRSARGLTAGAPRGRGRQGQDRRPAGRGRAHRHGHRRAHLALHQPLRRLLPGRLPAQQAGLRAPARLRAAPDGRVRRLHHPRRAVAEDRAAVAGAAVAAGPRSGLPGPARGSPLRAAVPGAVGRAHAPTARASRRRWRASRRSAPTGSSGWTWTCWSPT